MPQPPPHHCLLQWLSCCCVVVRMSEVQSRRGQLMAPHVFAVLLRLQGRPHTTGCCRCSGRQGRITSQRREVGRSWNRSTQGPTHLQGGPVRLASVPGSQLSNHELRRVIARQPTPRKVHLRQKNVLQVTLYPWGFLTLYLRGLLRCTIEPVFDTPIGKMDHTRTCNHPVSLCSIIPKSSSSSP